LLLGSQSRWLRILSCAIYVQKKKWGIDGSTPFKTGQLSHLCPKKAAWCWEKIMGRNQRRRLQKICHFLGHRWLNWPVLKGVEPSIPHFFFGHRWRNSRFWAIYFEIRVFIIIIFKLLLLLLLFIIIIIIYIHPYVWDVCPFSGVLGGSKISIYICWVCFREGGAVLPAMNDFSSQITYHTLI